ncbi:MAG: hypothetical protein WBK77_05135 [Alphaproteobacteria bacterium]
MGALTSKAKSISAPQVVAYTPASAEPSPPPAPTAEEQAAESRRKNLLGRDRSRFGTVQTGFRGLLALSPLFGQRKKLLGE